MMTVSELKAAVANAMADPEAAVFNDTNNLVSDLLAAAYAEVGRAAPVRFAEDINLVENARTYTLQASIFGSDGSPEIEVLRVEVWDGAPTPERPVYSVQSMHTEITYSDNGWQVWEGILELPAWCVRDLNTRLTDGFLRVWGYRPYGDVPEDGSDTGLSQEKEQAVILFARVEALRRLTAERDLFKQYQARASMSDMTPASLASEKRDAMEDWRRTKRELTVLRRPAG
jgi:hypothetical protein